MPAQKSQTKARQGPGKRGPKGPKGSDSPGFMHKLDERWERRERGH